MNQENNWRNHFLTSYFPEAPPLDAADFLLARLAEAEKETGGSDERRLAIENREVIERFAVWLYECADAASSYAAYKEGAPRFLRARLVEEDEVPALRKAAEALLLAYRNHPGYDPSWLPQSPKRKTS